MLMLTVGRFQLAEALARAQDNGKYCSARACVVGVLCLDLDLCLCRS